MGEFVVLEAPSLNPAEVRAYIGSQQGRRAQQSKGSIIGRKRGAGGALWPWGAARSSSAGSTSTSHIKVSMQPQRSFLRGTFVHKQGTTDIN